MATPRIPRIKKSAGLLAIIVFAFVGLVISAETALASCTVTLTAGETTSDSIRFDGNWQCTEFSGSITSKVSTSNSMSDRVGSASPSGSGGGIIAYGGGMGGFVEGLLPSTTYFVQYTATVSSGIYNSEILAIATKPANSTTTSTTSTTSPSSSGSTTSTTSPSSSGSTTKTTSPSSSGSNTSRNTTTTTEVDQIDDGTEDEDFANLEIKKSGSTFRISVKSTFDETEMKIQARAKGKKVISWNVTTGSEGGKRFATTRNLSGYRLTLWIDGDRWDSVTVK